MEDTHDLGLVPEAELVEIARPGGKWSITADPVITIQGTTATIACETKGASIAYRINPPADQKPNQQHWQLYQQPFKLTPGDKIETKACRLGWKDSETVTVVAN
jgi:hypothetical protein